MNEAEYETNHNWLGNEWCNPIFCCFHQRNEWMDGAGKSEHLQMNEKSRKTWSIFVLWLYKARKALAGKEIHGFFLNEWMLSGWKKFVEKFMKMVTAHGRPSLLDPRHPEQPCDPNGAKHGGWEPRSAPWDCVGASFNTHPEWERKLTGKWTVAREIERWFQQWMEQHAPTIIPQACPPASCPRALYRPC